MRGTSIRALAMASLSVLALGARCGGNDTSSTGASGGRGDGIESRDATSSDIRAVEKPNSGITGSRESGAATDEATDTESSSDTETEAP